MKPLKHSLRAGELAVGSWVSLGNAAIAEIMCAAGFDWVAIDLEHSSTTLAQTEDLIRTIALAGKAPLVRLTANDPRQIKRVMDSGAHGIIVPNVDSADEVVSAFRAMRYLPEGGRGLGLGRAQRYGAGLTEYREWLASSSVLVVQIEQVSALDRLDAIFSCPELDAFMIGPYDLSASLGIPGDFQHPEFVAVMDRILQAGKAHGKPAGIHVVEPDARQLQQRIDEGYRFIAYGVDFRMIDVSCRQGLRAIGR